MNEPRVEEKESATKKIEEENATTTRACARLFGVDINVARRLLWNTNLLLMDVFAASKRIKGMTNQDARAWIEYMDEVDYRFDDGKQVNRRNFRRSMRMFNIVQSRLAADEKRRRARKRGKRRDVSPDYEAIDARKRAIEAKRREEASKADGAWDLCAERCTNCLGGKHCPFYATPPQLREWPIAPEQCSMFKPLEAKGE